MPTQAQLDDLYNEISKWAFDGLYCPEYRTIRKGSESCEEGGGDTLVFHSLLYYSGEIWARDAIKGCQDEQGGFWRAPQRRISRSDGSYGGKRFSFDQALGVLLYLATENNYKDKRGGHDIGAVWASWIGHHKSQREFSLCDWKWSDQKAMNFCALEGTVYGTRSGLIRRVFNHCDISSPRRRAKWGRWYRFGDDESPLGALNQFALGCRGTTNPGSKFMCHLASLVDLILQEINQGSHLSELDETFAENPFSLWVRNGRHSNDNITQITYDRCLEAHESHKAGENRHNQWALERSQYERDSENRSPWRNSFGWDCLFMLNLVRKENPLTQLSGIGLVSKDDSIVLIDKPDTGNADHVWKLEPINDNESVLMKQSGNDYFILKSLVGHGACLIPYSGTGKKSASWRISTPSKGETTFAVIRDASGNVLIKGIGGQLSMHDARAIAPESALGWVVYPTQNGVMLLDRFSIPAYAVAPSCC